MSNFAANRPAGSGVDGTWDQSGMMIFILFGIGVLIGFALQYALHKYNSQSKSSDESSTNEDRAMDWAALKKLVENLQSSVWSLKDLVDKARSENAFKSGGRNQMHPSKTSLSQDDSHVVLNPLIDRINTLNLEVSATREAGAFLVREFAAMKKEVGVDGLRGEVGIMTKRISGFENRLDKFAEDIQNVVTYIIPHIQPAPQEPVLQSNSQPSVVRLAPGQSSVAEQGTSGRKGVSEGRVEQRIGIQSVQSAAHLVAVLNGYLTEGTAGLRDWKSYNQLRDGLVNAGAEVCFAQLTRGESGEVKRSLTRFHGSENDFGSFWASGDGVAIVTLNGNQYIIPSIDAYNCIKGQWAWLFGLTSGDFRPQQVLKLPKVKRSGEGCWIKDSDGEVATQC